jgi:hypothetical protein
MTEIVLSCYSVSLGGVCVNGRCEALLLAVGIGY